MPASSTGSSATASRGVGCCCSTAVSRARSPVRVRWSTRSVTCTTVDGRPAVITGSADFTALVWDLESGALRHTLSGHTDPIFGISVGTAYGQPVVVTCGPDEIAMVWELPGDEPDRGRTASTSGRTPGSTKQDTAGPTA